MKNKNLISYTFNWLVLMLLCFGCNIDETPPEIVGGIRGWFSIDNNDIGVKLSWYESEDDDFDKYNIFRSKPGSSPNIIGESESNFYIDRNVEWLETYQYFIQSVDEIGNESKLSDSMVVNIYSGSGMWNIANYDSISLCIVHNPTIVTSSGSIVQKGYHLIEDYEILMIDNLNDSTALVGDTINSKMLFSSCSVDSVLWTGNGWMTYEYTILDTTINGDTIKNVEQFPFPVYYSLDISDPDDGEISFSSPLFEPINIGHALKYCNGDFIFD